MRFPALIVAAVLALTASYAGAQDFEFVIQDVTVDQTVPGPTTGSFDILATHIGGVSTLDSISFVLGTDSDIVLTGFTSGPGFTTAIDFSQFTNPDPDVYTINQQSFSVNWPVGVDSVVSSVSFEVADGEAGDFDVTFNSGSNVNTDFILRDASFTGGTVTVTPIPEPATAAALVAGLGLLVRRRRRAA